MIDWKKRIWTADGREAYKVRYDPGNPWYIIYTAPDYLRGIEADVFLVNFEGWRRDDALSSKRRKGQKPFICNEWERERQDRTWRPIETAPRDGTKFWGECGEDAISMFWHSELEVFCSSFQRMQVAEGYTINGKSYEDHSPVTHQPSRWMPKPPPGEVK